MKKIVAMAMMAVLAVGSTRASVDAGEVANIALKDVVADARASLAQSKKVPPGEPVAILPIAEDAGLQIVELLKGAITQAGITCVEGKEDPMWDAILKEIEWDERKADILDPATLDKFGRLKSAKYLLYGSIRRLAASERYVLLELELHCSFKVGETFTGKQGVIVPLSETIKGCAEICAGNCDDWPEQAFYMTGTLDDVRKKVEELNGRNGTNQRKN